VPHDHGAPSPSSMLVHPIFIALCLVCCAASAFLGKTVLTIFCGFVFTLLLCSYFWGRLSIKKLTYSVNIPASGVFPGQSVQIKRTLSNNKLLPLTWLELFEMGENHSSFYTFSLLKWYQTLAFNDEWTAKKRGIHKISLVTLRSGDGFGLSSQLKRITQEPEGRIAVYPELLDVSVEKILNDIWDTRSASFGYLEDVTLVKSVRDYSPGDPAKRINHRQLAGGHGLVVNMYEVVSPNSVLFVLDTASFSGQPDENLEYALSVAASLVTGLSLRGIRVGLLAPASKHFEQTCVLPSSGEAYLARMLELMAGAGKEDAALTAIDNYPAPELVGQVYYITYSERLSTSLSVLAPFPAHKTQVLAFFPDDMPPLAHGLKIRPLHSFRRVS